MLISEDLTCEQLVELVTDYFEGALDARDRDRLEQHLVLCDGCAWYVEQVKTTIALSGSLAPEPISPEVEERMLDLFRGWKGG